MRIFTLIATFIWAMIVVANGQCDLSALEPINTPGMVLFADEECTDAAGWTHYYNSTSNKILLSIQKNGQDIGSIGQGMEVKAGTLPTFSNGAFDLSGADYIDNEIWVVANRYWQITGANAIVDSLKVRFYFSNTDVNDIASTVDDFGFFVNEPKDLYMFTIGHGGSLYPLATSTQPFNAIYTLYDMAAGSSPDWTDNSLNGFPYGEFWVKTLDVGGGAGFLIFQSTPPLIISGNIARPNGNPVPDVVVQAASISTAVTDANGDYVCSSLLSGSSYEVVPHKDINPAEGISVVDLIAIFGHASGSQLLPTPYQIIAADANADDTVTFQDVINVRDVLLGVSPNFINNTSWRFVPENYAFPTPSHPLATPFPERIIVPNLQDSLYNQDFVGIKIGDVADPSTAMPPALNTTFALPSLNACNPGDTIVFDLKVEDFQNIRGFQFTLEWNPNVLNYLTVSNFNLTNLNNSIGSTLANNGKLAFAWVNLQTSSGNTLPNGTTICKLKFIANGSIGSTTQLHFTGSLINMLVVHQNLTQVVPNTVSGSFIIDNNTTISASAYVQTTDCVGPGTGAIDLSATGGTPPLSYTWSSGATTQDIFGLVVDSYTVTINDASGNCPLVLSYDITPPAPMNLGSIVTDMSCPFVADGAIELQVAGGEAPFNYHWSDGATTRINDNLYEGSYSVTVTDHAGCTTTASFDIENNNQLVPEVTVTNSSNATKADGSLTITDITGGVGPFSFQWNNGATTQILLNLLTGDYVVTITDGVGCQHVFGYEVYGLFTGTVEAGGNLKSAAAYPNPVWSGEAFELVFSMKKAGSIKASLLSADGKLVSRSQFSIQAGQSTRQMEAPAVSGFYIVQFEVDGLSAGRLKLIVQ